MAEPASTPRSSLAGRGQAPPAAAFDRGRAVAARGAAARQPGLRPGRGSGHGEDFYRDDHRRILAPISKLIEADQPADVVTVAGVGRGERGQDKTGGPPTSARSPQNTPSALNIRRYARAGARALGAAAPRAGRDRHRRGARAIPAARRWRRCWTKPSRRSSRSPSPARAATRACSRSSRCSPKVFERIDHLYHRENPSDVTGVPTGYTGSTR